MKFYQDIVGLPVVRRFSAGPGIEICFLGEGETQVELMSSPNFQENRNLSGISIGFVVDSVEWMINFVKEKGLVVESGPLQPNPHVKFFFVRDPNGVSVQFVENII